MIDLKKVTTTVALSLALSVPGAWAQTGNQASGIQVVAQPSESPLVAIRLMFDVGSIHDPKGKEGLAALTASMVGESGTQKRSYTELLEALYPMAAAIQTGSDREVTLFSGLVHRDKLAEYTALLEEVLLQPAFGEQDFQRNKDQLQSFLTNTLPSNDELLGLEALQTQLWKGHPYGHPSAGTVEGLKSVTIDDVKKFYRDNYTQANLMLGVAGGYPKGYAEKLQKDLAALPKGQGGRTALPPAPTVKGRNFVIVEKETASVGLHFGFPLPVTRADADYFPLMVANSYLGEHRTFHGRLMQELRGARGLNYGDYSYMEYYAVPPFTSNPTPNVPRRQQYFSVWIRPVVPTDAQFALRAGMYEVQRLRDRGLTQAEFELTRDFLLNYTKLWAQSLPDRLGFQMDSEFYGTPYFIDEVDKRLRTMKVEEVNAAVKKYLSLDNFAAVLITSNAAQVQEMLQKDAPSPKTYNSPVAAEVSDADKTIQAIPVKPTRIEIVPVAALYEK
ncbi:MAG TPA: pitrilysin family protein [Thermoanaerobaculia bacterium]|jgi:zinc protease|nr:pitrilysin family protein [Thermoanaerobaculia bacterium]